MSDWWRGGVLYHIIPRSFRDSNGDGIGDLAGITGGLDHVAGLGADGVWLSPFYLSPMEDFGYDVVDHCAVDPSFGTLDDFDVLLERAHSLGLKLLIDLVWSHTSARHPWFLESRTAPQGAKADWYVWADPRPDGTPPNNWLSVFGGSAWSWEPCRRQYYLHHFLASQPALNLRHPKVLEALDAIGEFWLARGVDGFRLDAVDFLLHDELLRDNPPRPPADGVIPLKPFALQEHLWDMARPEAVSVMRRVRNLLARHPGSTTIAEVSSEPDPLARANRYTAGAEHLHMAYTLRLMRRGFSAALLAEAIADVEARVTDGWLCWAFSNHDVERAVSRWGDGSPDFAKLLMALLLSLRGSVCVYQGEELGLTEASLSYEALRDPFGKAFWPAFKGRDGSRTPLPWYGGAAQAGFSSGTPWLPIPEEHRPLAIDRQSADARSVLNAWRRFLAWRRHQPALREGALTLLPQASQVLAFERHAGQQRLLCLFNCARAPAVFALPDGWRQVAGHGLAPAEVGSAEARLAPFGAAYFAAV
jgi:alpha-glucosidase